MERTIVPLFANDTTVYLSRRDDFHVLLNILNKWCAASGAKFNISKTKLVPLGPEEYCAVLLATQTLDGDQPAIPEHMALTPDGIAKWLLGAWIGNRTNQEGIWAPTLAKIQKSLDTWEQTFPTVKGRKIIIQWTIGGMTQYLANVQGMPRAIEKQLEAMSKSFIWDKLGKSLINKETMSNDIKEGGKRLLDIKKRNEAIILTWV